MATCIYCGYEGELSKEHSLPDALGTFRDRETLKNTLCDNCNNKIGRMEEQLLRSSPVAFKRLQLGLWKIDVHSDEHPSYRGSNKVGPMETAIPFPGFKHELLIAPVPGTNNAVPMRQIVFKKPDGTYQPVRVKNSTKTSEQFEANISGLDLAKAEVCFIYDPDGDTERLLSLVSDRINNDKLKAKSITIPTGPFDATTTIYGSKDFTRAIAKICFHHAIQHFANIRGDEDEFESIRDYILHGQGDTESFVTITENIMQESRMGQVPQRWCHLILIEQSQKFVRSKCQLFLGPESPPPCFVVKLGENPSRVIPPSEKVGIVYTYLKDEVGGNYDGAIEIDRSPLMAPPGYRGLKPPIPIVFPDGIVF